jgi:hypothetical protein
LAAEHAEREGLIAPETLPGMRQTSGG